MAVDRRLIFLMHRAHRALTARANAVAISELGVSSAQLGMLYHVAKHPGCTMSDVADLLDLNKSAASGMVQRLERGGLLRREPDPRDGRASRLFVTDKGEAKRTQSLTLVRRLTSELTGTFTAAEVEVIYRFLNLVIDRYASEEAEGSTP
jgi:DNA-binding MarR family transcriptional regulator